MDRRQWIDRDQTAGLGESRLRILELLRSAAGPLGVQEVAKATGVHTNTARFHLDGLVNAGLAERQTESRDQPGRPRVVYRAVTTGAVPGARSYRLLAEILTGVAMRAATDPAAVATDTGRTWGQYLADRPAPYERVRADQAIDKLTGILNEIGFAAEVVRGRRPQILLRHCPFREIAEHSPQIVCAIHLGLMQGALAEMRAPVTADRLEPFVEPSLCRAHLSHGGDAAPAN